MEQVSTAAQRLARSTTMPERLAVLRQVMADKLMKPFAATPEFGDGLRAMAQVAQSDSSATERLLAIDGMIRIWNSSVPNSIKTDIEKHISSALENELPPLSALNDLQDSGVDKPSESRLNAVLALKLSTAAWIDEYRFRNLLEEDRAPKVRLELARQLLRREISLEALLARLAILVRDRKSSWQLRAETNRRRLRDLVASLGDATHETDTDPGDQFGQALALLVDTTLGHRGPSSLDSETTSLSVELIRVTLIAIRSRLSLLLDPRSYEVIRQIGAWWGPVTRPEKLQEALAPLARRLEDAILVLSRMGQRSNELMNRYLIAIGDEKSARLRIADHIERYVGIDPLIIQWLRTGITVDTSHGQRTSDELNRIADQQSDAAIALLMVDAQRLIDGQRGGRPANNSESLPRIDAEAADLAAGRLANDILALGRERSLEIRGKFGDQVEFNPAAHEPVGALPTEPTVSVISPAVVRKSSIGREVVVLKGRVKGRA